MRVRVPWLLSLLATFVILTVAARPVRAAESAVLVLRSRAFAPEEARLVEALRIYTRDLECRILVTGEAPLSADGADLALRQLRNEGGDVAVWVQKRTDGRLVYDLLAVNQPDLRETEIGPSGAIAAAEAVALKIRTLLSRRTPAVEAQDRSRDPAPEASTSAKTASPVTRPTPDPTPPKAVSPVAVLPPRPVDARAATSGPEGPPPAVTARDVEASTANWLSLGAAYGVVVPRELGWVRHGLMFSGEVRLGPGPWSAIADVSLTFRAEEAAPGHYTVSLDDLPVGLGLWRHWALGRWGWTAGPRAALHVFHVSGVELTDGRLGSVRRVSTGLGGAARVEFRLRDTVQVYGSASLEALVPTRNFTLSGTRVLATGPGLAGLFVGLLLAVP